MWFNLDLEGFNFHMKIWDWRPVTRENIDDNWCSVQLNLIAKDSLNKYIHSDLLCAEIERFVDFLDQFEQNQIQKKTSLDFLEPDLQFVFYPNGNAEGCRSLYKIEEPFMEMFIYFWCGYPTNNHLALTFYKKEIQLLANYLKLVIGRLKSNSPEIQQMRERGILTNDI